MVTRENEKLFLTYFIRIDWTQIGTNDFSVAVFALKGLVVKKDSNACENIYDALSYI